MYFLSKLHIHSSHSNKLNKPPGVVDVQSSPSDEMTVVRVVKELKIRLIKKQRFRFPDCF